MKGVGPIQVSCKNASESTLIFTKHCAKKLFNRTKISQIISIPISGEIDKIITYYLQFYYRTPASSVSPLIPLNSGGLDMLLYGNNIFLPQALKALRM